MDFRLQSPYCNTYKIPNQQKGLIMQHLIVRKLTRRELEDKYLRLVDENYDLKRENNMQKEKIKVLTTKLLRLSKENSKYKSREFLFMDENNEIQEAEEFFRPHRPVSSSAIPRDATRNSTPNLASRYKSDFFLHENSNIDIKNQQNSVNEMENSGVKNKDSFEATAVQMREMEEEIDKLTLELKKLQDLGELEKRTNAQLEIQVSELKEKLCCKKIQSELEANVEIAELNKRIKELQAQLDDVEKNYQKKMEESKNEQEKLNDLLEKERQKMKKIQAQTHDVESSQRMVDSLMERIAMVEKEKAEIASQFEKYASISDEVVICRKRMNDMSEALEAKEKALEKERQDKASIEHSQDELLKKMKELQKENDQLVVKLEGLKTENEGLINKNKKLEDRIKVLDDQNQQQLHQINETLKMPAPVYVDRDTIQAKSQKDVHKIDEIRVRSLEVDVPPSLGGREFSRSSTSLQLSSSPPSLVIPTVNVSDEKRPASLGKDLKVIPKIVEPATDSSETASKLKDRGNTSTINSQDVSTLPQDSPVQGTSKAFMDAFSRSFSKDPPSADDDDFDPRTFSIDQLHISLEESCNKSGRSQSTVIVRQSSMENAVERAFNNLMEEVITGTTEKKQTQKRVRMSLDTRYPSFRTSQASNVPFRSQSRDHGESDRTPHRESSGEFLKFNSSSSRASSISSSGSRRTSKIPSFLLDSIDDKKLILQHSANSIEIEINSLEVVPNSSLLELAAQDPKFLYVEYTFLGYKGHLLETQSLPQPRKENGIIYFHYNQKFEIEPEENPKHLEMLKSLIAQNSKEQIKFLIVSEPLADNNTEAECEEIGFAVFKLSEVITESSSNSYTRKLEVYSTDYPHNLIAILTIKIRGVAYLRDLADMKQV